VFINQDSVANQVLQNCQITDACYAGFHSICGLALRLRDLYKWEKRLDPWVEDDPQSIIEWIGEKEEVWERLSKRELVKIRLCGHAYDPFDTRAINAALEPLGLFYGAGYVQGMRPTFFLALLEEKREMQGYPVYLLGSELVRDLLTLPALTQDNSVLIRKESTRLFLYNQIFFIQKSGLRALDVALECYGLNRKDFKTLRSNLNRIIEAEIETQLYHELGELREKTFDRGTWREIIATYPHSPIELLARAVKDLLADMSPEGLLYHFIKREKKASLALYVAFLDGLRKELFPEIIAGFDKFLHSGDWQPVEEAILWGYKRMATLAKEMCAIHKTAQDRNDVKWGKQEMERHLLGPLNITGKKFRNSSEFRT
jgi:hypothetical protein